MLGYPGSKGFFFLRWSEHCSVVLLKWGLATVPLALLIPSEFSFQFPKYLVQSQLPQGINLPLHSSTSCLELALSMKHTALHEQWCSSYLHKLVRAHPTWHLGTWHDPFHHFRNPCFSMRLELCPSCPFAAGHSSALWGQLSGTLQPTWHIPGYHVGPKLAAPEGWPSSLAHWRGQDSTVNPWGGVCQLWGNVLAGPNNGDWGKTGGLVMGASKAVQGSSCHPSKYWVSAVNITRQELLQAPCDGRGFGNPPPA